MSEKISAIGNISQETFNQKVIVFILLNMENVANILYRIFPLMSLS